MIAIGKPMQYGTHMMYFQGAGRKIPSATNAAVDPDFPADA
jgi:hypothetical protein